MIILSILGYLLLFILTIISLLIIIPVDYSIEGYKYEETIFSTKVSLFAGILKLHISLNNLHLIKTFITLFGYTYTVDMNLDKDRGKFSVIKNKPKEVYNKTKKDINKESKTYLHNNNRSNDIFEYINKDLFIYCLNFIKSIWNNIKPNSMHIKAYYGFDDPYNTAMICALFSSLYPLLVKYTVSLTPSFNESILRGEFKIKGRIALIYLIYIIIKFVVTNPIRSIIKNIIRNKKEEKLYAN